MNAQLDLSVSHRVRGISLVALQARQCIGMLRLMSKCPWYLRDTYRNSNKEFGR